MLSNVKYHAQGKVQHIVTQYDAHSRAGSLSTSQPTSNLIPKAFYLNFTISNLIPKRITQSHAISW